MFLALNEFLSIFNFCYSFFRFAEFFAFLTKLKYFSGVWAGNSQRSVALCCFRPFG